MFMVHNPQFTGRQIAEQVTEEIAAIQKSGVPEKELQRARTFVRLSVTRRMESSINRATLLGQYEMLDGDASFINTEIDKLLAVTGEDIQAAAKKYFQPQLRVIIEIAPNKDKKEAAQ